MCTGGLFQQQQVRLLFCVVLHVLEQGSMLFESSPSLPLHFLPWPTAPPRELWLSSLLPVLERINIFTTASECWREMTVDVSMTLTYSWCKYNSIEGGDEEMLE